MDSYEAEQERRRIKRAFEAMGDEMGMDGRCIASWFETSVTFEDKEGNQHHFTFVPTLGDEEK